MRSSFLVAAALVALPAAALAAETITYQYDARGRLIKVERSGSANGATNTTYQLDKADNRTARTVTVPLSFSVADATVTEGNFLYVTVTKAGSTSQSCTVDYTTANGTAVHPTDYGGASSSVTFTASQTTFQLSFAVHSDGATEGSETMRILLSNPSCGAIISDGEATGTINDP